MRLCFCGQNRRFGPSDRDRTCGLMVPNHPRSQLRHTRILFDFFGFCVEVGQTVVKRKIYAVLRFRKVPKTRINKGLSGFIIFYGVLPRARSQTTRATNRFLPAWENGRCPFSRGGNISWIITKHRAAPRHTSMDI